MELSRLQQTILYLLMFAKKKGVEDLSKYQLMKILYLIEIEARRYLGSSFIKEIHFHRYPRGPISIDIYNAVRDLQHEYIVVEEKNIEGYAKPRECHSLKEGTNAELTLTPEEKIFLNSVISDYVLLPQQELKKVVYETEPMLLIQEEEKQKGTLVGAHISFESVKLDEELLTLISDEDES